MTWSNDPIPTTYLDSGSDSARLARSALDQCVQDMNAIKSGTLSTVGPFAYGAVGDGVADDTLALQATLDAAAAISGITTVDLQGRTYAVSDTLSLGAWTILSNGRFTAIGAGWAATDPMIAITGGRSEVHHVRMTLNELCSGVEFRAYRGRVFDCFIIDFKAGGFGVNLPAAYSASNNAANVLFSHIVADYVTGGDAVYIDASDAIVAGNYLSGARGLVISGGGLMVYGNHFIAGSAPSADWPCIYHEEKNAWVEGNYFEGNVYIQGNPDCFYVNNKFVPSAGTRTWCYRMTATSAGQDLDVVRVIEPFLSNNIPAGTNVFDIVQSGGNSYTGGLAVHTTMAALSGDWNMSVRGSPTAWLKSANTTTDVLRLGNNHNSARIALFDNNSTAGAKIGCAGDTLELFANGTAMKVQIAADGSMKLPTLTAAPATPANGMIVYADGVGWNPGLGEGFYGYQAGAWVKFA